MQNTEQITYIVDPIEITAHIETLINRRIRGNINTESSKEPIRVIFLGHSGVGKDSYLLVERLIRVETSNRVYKGEDLTVSYFEDGIGYSFESGSIDVEERDGCIKLRFPARVLKKQKRRFFRMPLPSVKPLDVIINTDEIAGKYLVADISGGGLAFFTSLDKEFLKLGMELTDIQLTLPDGYLIKTGGIIRSHFPTENRDPNKKYCCGIEFVGIRESVQDRIVTYVINCQKEEIKRRKERFL